MSYSLGFHPSFCRAHVFGPHCEGMGRISHHSARMLVSRPCMSGLLVEEPLEALVSSQRCNGRGGVAFSVGQPQRFSGSGLLQQEACDLTETSAGSKMQQSLLRMKVWGGEKNTLQSYRARLRAEGSLAANCLTSP